jgi:sugar lactone lactonase YvrE
MKALLRMMFVGLIVSQLGFHCLAQVGIITTYAGPSLPLNGALATTQAIDSPIAVVLDGAGGFYVASASQNNVYRVSAAGRITLIAGTGVQGVSGDGRQATLAQLNWPQGLAVDSAGNLFIADSGNNRIRKVSASGIITTVAGGGTKGPGDGVPATSVQLTNPSGIAVDSAGNLFIADNANKCIRKVSSSSGIITTVAGIFGGSSVIPENIGDGGSATSAQLGVPYAVAVDSADNIFIASYNRIRKVSSSSGIITTVAGGGSWDSDVPGGPATSAMLDSPSGIAIDSAGNLFISERSSIRKVSASSEIISTVAGSPNCCGDIIVIGDQNVGDGGPATSAQLTTSGVAVDSAGNLFIADRGYNRIRKVSTSGIITTVAGNGSYGYGGDGGPSTSALLYDPYGVAIDSSGNLFIADTFNSSVRKVSTSGIIITVAGNGTYGYSGDGGPATSAQLSSPRGLAVDSAGNLFIADSGNYRIRRVSSSGIITTVAGNGTYGYSGDEGPATSAQISSLCGLAVDSAGNLFIADSGNRRIRRVSSSGIITNVAGNGSREYSGDDGPATSAELGGPIGVAVDSAGNLFIAGGGSIRKVSSSGIITTIAGNAYNGYSGDGGPATLAQLNLPQGLAVDSSGNLFIADTFNSRIRMVASSGIITTVAGGGTNRPGDGVAATATPLCRPSGVAVDFASNLFIADTCGNRILKVSKPNESADIALSAGGVGQSSTVGGNLQTQPGYATVSVESGSVPYGTAVFSFEEGGVTVSEAGVPASPPTVSARVFIDYRSSVNALPARDDAGIVDINTGIAAVNLGTATANVTYTLRNASGSTIALGHGTIAAGRHIGCFINQLKDVVPDFNLPENFQTAIQFGILDITSDLPLSVMALRGTINQRQQFIYTTTPVAVLTQSPGSSPLYFAQFADGGGYTTSLILMNTSTATETGTLQIMDNNGASLAINQFGGSSGSSFSYSIPANGIYRFQTDGSPVDLKTGWVKLIPDPGTSTPAGSGIFGYNPVDVLVTESGVPGASATTHARIYVDQSGTHNTGLAITNINDAAANITINAFESDGVTATGTSNGSLTLAAHGHDAKFTDQIIEGLPAGFTGILDINSTTPFAALTMRSLYNGNNDYLMTTFPLADMNQTAPSPIVFPQIADGGGYATQVILMSTGGTSSTTIHYYDNNGQPLPVGR